MDAQAKTLFQELRQVQLREQTIRDQLATLGYDTPEKLLEGMEEIVNGEA